MRCSLLVEESQERWEDLRGPEAIIARLRAIETRLEQIRGELGEVAGWADHPAASDILRTLKRVREMLQDAARQVRHERERRVHG